MLQAVYLCAQVCIYVICSRLFPAYGTIPILPSLLAIHYYCCKSSWRANAIHLELSSTRYPALVADTYAGLATHEFADIAFGVLLP